MRRKRKIAVLWQFHKSKVPKVGFSEKYEEVGEEIGETGAGITGKEEIDVGSTLANKWIEPAGSPVQQLELGFLDDVISLSDIIKHGEEEEKVDKFTQPPREELEIIEYKRKSDIEKGADFTSKGKKGHRIGIVPKTGSKHHRGKLTISNSCPSWTIEVKEIINTLLDQSSSSSKQDNHSNRCLHSSSYSKKYKKLTDQEEDRTTQSSDHHQQAWQQFKLEKLAVERDRMRHERDMMILKFRLERGDQLADIENM
ncbi:hypothetical protein B9Z19DRAFT_1061040 [Tuber borchii]|uniref:Uncharacterized protein n=1 Tax=Tuber borchii TaxID=42251 RepID=A0A2T7A6T0_TUBBO|nr:hypothetical protein B9Z19DRAFT_1061040 [Tuber borchii]